jgi:anti-sigma B factor antagonist
VDEIKISLDASDDPGGIAVVRVDGVVDTMTAGELENVMNSLIDQKRFNIVVDLGGVDYISSAGWGIFISNIREIRQNRGDIKLAQMIPSVYEIFELLEFDSILSAFDSVEKARLDFRGATSAQPQAGDSIAVLQAPPESAPRFEPSLEPDPERAPRADSVQREWTLHSALQDICRRDPFLSTGEIRRALAGSPYDIDTGWWAIWTQLRRLGLGSKKRRFELSRSQRAT